jgi:hypothetical protein
MVTLTLHDLFEQSNIILDNLDLGQGCTGMPFESPLDQGCQGKPIEAPLGPGCQGISIEEPLKNYTRVFFDCIDILAAECHIDNLAYIGIICGLIAIILLLGLIMMTNGSGSASASGSGSSSRPVPLLRPRRVVNTN